MGRKIRAVKSVTFESCKSISQRASFGVYNVESATGLRFAHKSSNI
jgi:hypothetical protein